MWLTKCKLLECLESKENNKPTHFKGWKIKQFNEKYESSVNCAVGNLSLNQSKLSPKRLKYKLEPLC